VYDEPARGDSTMTDGTSDHMAIESEINSSSTLTQNITKSNMRIPIPAP
jgi:hypothetical protein